VADESRPRKIGVGFHRSRPFKAVLGGVCRNPLHTGCTIRHAAWQGVRVADRVAEDRLTGIVLYSRNWGSAQHSRLRPLTHGRDDSEVHHAGKLRAVRAQCGEDSSERAKKLAAERSNYEPRSTAQRRLRSASVLKRSTPTSGACLRRRGRTFALPAHGN